MQYFLYLAQEKHSEGLKNHYNVVILDVVILDTADRPDMTII